MTRYERNHTAISPQEQSFLATQRVLVVGCGGLGGYLLEALGRLGIGHLTAVDGDVFSVSNLNRQLLCSEGNLGQNKALAAEQRIKQINSTLSFQAVPEFLTENNADSLVCGHHLVVDALDNAASRTLLFQAACRAEIPMIHGAVAGWSLRIAAVFPGDTTLPALWKMKSDAGLETQLGTLAFTVSCAAALEAAEAVKLLLGRGKLLRNSFLEVDLLNSSFIRLEL